MRSAVRLLSCFGSAELLAHKSSFGVPLPISSHTIRASEMATTGSHTQQDNQTKLKPWMTEEVKEVLNKRDEAKNTGREEYFKTLTKQIKKQLRKETRKWLHSTIDKDLSEKYRWMGLRSIKQGYKPQPYYRSDKHGNSISFDKQAEATAEYLETVQWAKVEETKPESMSKKTQWYHKDRGHINRHPPNYDTGIITREEFVRIIKRMKKRKSTRTGRNNGRTKKTCS